MAVCLNLSIFITQLLEIFAKRIEFSLFEQSNQEELPFYPVKEVEKLIRLQSSALFFIIVSATLTAYLFLNIGKPIRVASETQLQGSQATLQQRDDEYVRLRIAQILGPTRSNQSASVV